MIYYSTVLIRFVVFKLSEPLWNILLLLLHGSTQLQLFKEYAHPELKSQSLCGHPHADGKSGEVLLSMTHFWSFAVKRILLNNCSRWGLVLKCIKQPKKNHRLAP